MGSETPDDSEQDGKIDKLFFFFFCLTHRNSILAGLVQNICNTLDVFCNAHDTELPATVFTNPFDEFYELVPSSELSLIPPANSGMPSTN